ncbi:ThiJ/PfpI family protein [Xylariales sp. PMI_506]|nr:ThiJ/PfpI family protein [Xylariales sp. PMI_506]
MGVPSRKTVRIGVFIPTECQLLDQACVDVFASMSYEYLSLMSDIIPKVVIESAPSIKVYYIGSVKPGEHIPLTANQKIVATNHYTDPEVAPGQLDVVLVPGPDPKTRFEKPVLEWLADQGARDDTDILSVCTGIFLCGEAGLLKGKKICGPRGLQDIIREKYGEDITQLGAELRWVQDGNFWSSGGITNGNDLVAAYTRQKSEFFPSALAELGAQLVDVGDRDQRYNPGQTAWTLSLVLKILRLSIRSLWVK